MYRNISTYEITSYVTWKEDEYKMQNVSVITKKLYESFPLK